MVTWPNHATFWDGLLPID